jgi:hypothetical protein
LPWGKILSAMRNQCLGLLNILHRSVWERGKPRSGEKNAAHCLP